MEKQTSQRNKQMSLVFSPNLLNEAPYRTVQKANTKLFNQLKPNEKQLLKEWGYKNNGVKNAVNSHLFLVAYIKYHSLNLYRIKLQQAYYQDVVNPSKELKNDILKGFKLEAIQELMNYIVELIELNRKNRLNIKITDYSEQLYILIDDMVDQELEDWTDVFIKRQLGKFKLLLTWRELKLSSEIEEENYNTCKSNIETLQKEGYQLESSIDLNTDSNALKDSLKKLVLKKTHQDLKDTYSFYIKNNLESLGYIYKLDIANIENIATDLSQLLVDNLSEDWQSQSKYTKLLGILNDYLTSKEYPKNVANDMSKDLLIYADQMEQIKGMIRLKKLTNAKAA